MVDVFKTNVQRADQAKMLIEILLEHFPNSDVNFDLEDCDKILRVKHNGINTNEIAALLNEHGYVCEELQD